MNEAQLIYIFMKAETHDLAEPNSSRSEAASFLPTVFEIDE